MISQASPLVFQEVKDRVARVSVSHPPANSQNGALLAKLEVTFQALDMKDEDKFVVITSAGVFLLSGADIHMWRVQSISTPLGSSALFAE